MDKILHICLSMSLCILIQAWCGLLAYDREDSIKIAAGFTLFLGFAKEVVLDQRFDSMDMLANLIGIMLGAIVGVMI